MITQDNFKDLLEFLGFTRNQSIYSNPTGAPSLSVDMVKRTINYPESDGLVVNERQTCNFSANENFVVFECVYRLLEKGYKPEHIELEPKWKVGRGASGGRADILVKDHSGKPLLIIECKTAGSEFSKAWNKTQQDGDQLFSYAQQISETQFLCLYTSDFESGKGPTYQSHIIAHRDNDQYLVANPHFKAFRDATDVKERFAVWRDTYKLDFTTKGIFEDNIQPYHIGKDKYSIADLHAISASDQQKKYHEFATILRQHNVSGRENAFDKLVNLFLCKLVDEIENPDDLKFYWKGVAYDSHFDLMDRLQRLYQSGMNKFLGEDITYINQHDVNNAMRFIRQNPDATQRAVWNLFIQQKFFTNNDFSFIDVHNERLFYQNAEVLLKILQMWQDIRLTNPNGHNQFLGDMFEGFLDQGVKQSEGQFFTPMPICRFILMSLPLESLVRDNPTPPMVIDYACGAGHFLTELALQIQPLVEQHKPQTNLAEYHKSMVGIEKEYRLSKVAKVSAFMYGHRDIQICYGDGLVKSHDAFLDIRDGHFDLLVANPPYSVRGFLETLPDEERKAYTLTDTINDAETANSIETFFVERAKQLLKSGGVAAIILPSSILSNGSSTYIRAREILLQYFDIVAIAEFGSGTFGKTGTNTVTLFLRRKPTQPDTAEHYRERVDEWFKGCTASKCKQVIYKDGHLIEQYCTHINVPLEDYQSLLRGEAEGSWKQQAHFQPYHGPFDKSAELVNLRKQKKFNGLSKDEQTAEIARRYLGYVQTIERNKLYHFCLASDQANPVLIIRSPTDTNGIKNFLGYEWSSAKGNEGIKLIEDAGGSHITTLYDGPDHANPMRFTRTNPAKLNSHIAANFDGTLGAIPEGLSEFAFPARLVDMLDFSKAVFEKQFSLSVKNAPAVTSRWPLVNLDRIAEIRKGTSITQEKATPGEYKVVAGGVDFAYTHNQSNRPPHTITISASGANAGFVNFWEEKIFASDCLTVRGENDDHTKYLFNILKCRQDEIQSYAKGSAQPHVYLKDIASMQIPKADIETQHAIVKECGAIDHEVETARSVIERCKNNIEKTILDAENNGNAEKIGNLIEINPESGDPKELFGTDSFIYLDISSVESGTGRIDFSNKLKPEDAPSRARRIVKPHDVLLSTVRPNLKSFAYLTNLPERVLASTGFAVLRAKERLLPKYLYYLLFGSRLQNQMIAKMGKGQYPSINKTDIENFMIPVLSIAYQQQFIVKIESQEQQIAEAQAIIDSAPARKEEVMKKYL